MMTHSDQSQYDAIIVGSGAGGSAAAYQLARAGLRVALLEKGRDLPRDGSTLDVKQVVHDGRFKSQEPWLDGHGNRFSPEEYFNVGGKTKWYGAALLRYGRNEFAADKEHQCLAWPLAYDDLAPYYDQAEKLLGVRCLQCEPDLQRILERLANRDPMWRAESLPLGLSPQILNYPNEARHFDGFASKKNLKGDGESAFLRPVRSMPNLSLITGAEVTGLLSAADDVTHIKGVRLTDSTVLYGRAVMLAAGALHSPRLLQRHIEEQRLTNRLPCYANVGRNLKMHLLTAMVAISASRQTDVIRKTTLLLDDSLPHSSVQPLGFDGGLISTLIPKFVPRFLARQIGERAYGFFLQTEDGAHADNRVIAAGDTSQGMPVLDYNAARTPAALREHQRLVSRFRGALARISMMAFSERIGLAGTAHVSGTLMTGNDPSTSVVDAQGQVHGLKSLYVVDGSILPRSSRVNPSLTIYAWSLRVAAELAQRLTANTSTESREPVPA